MKSEIDRPCSNLKQLALILMMLAISLGLGVFCVEWSSCFQTTRVDNKMIEAYKRHQKELEYELYTARQEIQRYATKSDSIEIMKVRASTIAKRMMDCFGEPGAAVCRPVGLSQTDHPEIVVGPIVTCLGGRCCMVRE